MSAPATLNKTAIQQEITRWWQTISQMPLTGIQSSVTNEELIIGNLTVRLESDALYLSLDDFAIKYIEPAVRQFWAAIKQHLSEMVGQGYDVATPAPDKIDSILADRSKTHGSFFDNARITATIRQVLRNTPNWKNLLPEQQLSLDEIALKQARILSNGSAHLNPEHWTDLAGYGILGLNACHTSGKNENN